MKALVVAAVVMLTVTACGSGTGETSAGGTGAGQGTTVTVYAAASLTDSFEDLAAEFEADHPGVNVELNFAGSSTLVTQLEDGAPADVFASADEATMDKAVNAGLIAGRPAVFATNELTIAVPPGNPAGISSFEDLARDGVATVVCEQRVPCGAATRKLEDLTGVSLRPVSEESAVTDVMGKVTSGQADAGVVYKTDVSAAGDSVQEVALRQADQVVNRYPIATLEASDDAALAQEFVDFVRGERGRARLAEEGFGAP